MIGVDRSLRGQVWHCSEVALGGDGRFSQYSGDREHGGVAGWVVLLPYPLLAFEVTDEDLFGIFRDTMTSLTCLALN